MGRRDEVPGPPREVYALRLGDDERKRLEAAAAGRGVPLAAFIRRTALVAAEQELTQTDEG